MNDLLIQHMVNGALLAVSTNSYGVANAQFPSSSERPLLNEDDQVAFDRWADDGGNNFD
jgi:hypothetical protein